MVISLNGGVISKYNTEQQQRDKCVTTSRGTATPDVNVQWTTCGWVRSFKGVGLGLNSSWGTWGSTPITANVA